MNHNPYRGRTINWNNQYKLNININVNNKHKKLGMFEMWLRHNFVCFYLFLFQFPIATEKGK